MGMIEMVYICAVFAAGIFGISLVAGLIAHLINN